MRTLIIDNYDSFTYNLVDLVAQATGRTPVVVRNDEPGWTPAELEHFDNVVISPGPGRPDRRADFGVCADAIAAATRPLLGVCLGHQGLCQAYGGEIERAPEVFHGRRSPIVHEHVDVLAGLPSPFAAVRYHSLIATRLPEELEAIAWTPEGLVMAVRHRRLPLWGVQFHPESIQTEHGQRIVSNFVALTRRWEAGRSGRASSPRPRRPFMPPAPVEARIPTSPSPNGLRVLHRSLTLDVPAPEVFEALYRQADHCFWLDSSLRSPEHGRFSFMGDAAGPLARVVEADVWTERITVTSAVGTHVVEGSFFDWLDADLAAHRVAAGDLPFDFVLGWVGYLGYELKAECGAERAHRSTRPDAAMVFADRVIAFDHAERTIHLLALTEGDDDRVADAWLRTTAATLASLAEDRTVPNDGTGAAVAPAAGPELGPLALRVVRSRYLDHIATCQEQIAAGETYEVCLTTMVTACGDLDARGTYHRLRRDNPAPFGALLELGTLSVLASSPERFLRVSSDGLAESRPIKGTRPRGADEAQDERLRRELGESAKDRAENLMIVDLVRNDLGTCAEVGSVAVDPLFDVETYATVHQLVSTVRAQLRPEVTAVHCVRKCFPGGSMTGAPKLRTMQIIDALEEGPRGVYSGALGYFSLTGAADFAMVIRTLVSEPGTVEFGVGGAIIALSEPDAEFEELAVKATSILRVLGQEFPGRSTVDDDASARLLNCR